MTSHQVRTFRGGTAVALVCILSLLLGGCQTDSSFPRRPITLICPWSAGGGTDQVARQIASQLEGRLGVPVNVINATGGGGVTGHTRGALARPDGYTITMITAELNMLHWRGLTNITWRDYRPLMQVNQDNAALFVRDDAPWDTMKQLESAVRKQPGELTASGTAFGGVWHIALAGWLTEAGLPADALSWISMGGSAPSLQELMAGGIEVVSCSVPEARSLLEAGEIKCLGVMAETRLSDLPNVPTLQEQGYDWTGKTWRGIAVPAGTPDDRFRVLLNALRDVVESTEYKEFLEQSGFGYTAKGPEAFRASLKEENQAYGEIFNSEAFQQVRSQRYGPMLFPGVLGALGLLVVVTLLVRGRLIRPATEAEPYTQARLQRIAGMLGAIFFYLLLAEVMGYVITAALLLALLFALLGVSWRTGLAIICVLVPLTYQVFGGYLRVPLPWGWFGW